MWTLTHTFLRKLGIVARGIAAGIGATLLTSAGLFVVGMTLSLMGNAGWIHLGEDQPWLPIAGLEYGFFLGLILGAAVCWRVCHSMFREVRPELDTARLVREERDSR